MMIEGLSWIGSRFLIGSILRRLLDPATRNARPSFHRACQLRRQDKGLPGTVLLEVSIAPHKG